MRLKFMRPAITGLLIWISSNACVAPKSHLHAHRDELEALDVDDVDVVEEYRSGQTRPSNDVHIEQTDVVKAEQAEDEQLHNSLNLADHAQKAEVQRWIRYFAHDDRERFARFLHRGMRYRKMIKSILKKQGVPTYLYYLAMIESGFSIHAHSRASAVGVWQFIAPTARRYGLKVNGLVDERKDPIRSTLAATEYLKDLFNVFQSWPLAMAAYNAGEMRIVGSIMSQKSRDFWDLARRQKLPRETRHYIPKMIAAALIGNHPEAYGFEIGEVASMEPVKAVSFPSPIKLVSVSKATGIRYARLKKLNPHIKGSYTPGSRTYRIWLPENLRVDSKVIAAIPRVRLGSKFAQHGGYSTYRVRRGDSLHRIARKFSVSIAALKRRNGMRSNRIYAGQSLKIPRNARSNGSKHRYRVRRGDNLYKIAQKFRTTIGKLKRINGMKTSRIYVGQIIKVKA